MFISFSASFTLGWLFLTEILETACLEKVSIPLLLLQIRNDTSSKDDDMHPTFKTKWPFMIWWLRDLFC